MSLKKTNGKDMMRVLEEIRNAPATSEVIAQVLEIPKKSASAHLSELFQLGLVTRRLQACGHYLYRAKAV